LYAPLQTLQKGFLCPLLHYNTLCVMLYSPCDFNYRQ
jgi:hypothetical protein